MNHLCVCKFDEKKSWSLVLRNQMHMMNNEAEIKKVATVFPQESCRTCSRSNYPWELQKTNKTQQRHCTIEAGWRCWCKNVSTDLSTTLWRWLHWESWACLWLEFYLRCMDEDDWHMICRKYVTNCFLSKPKYLLQVSLEWDTNPTQVGAASTCAQLLDQPFCRRCTFYLKT